MAKLELESIQPWNGVGDTGKDVRLKLDRNFEKIAVKDVDQDETLEDHEIRIHSFEASVADKGRFATSELLVQKWPVGATGWNAFVEQTDTTWIWNAENETWEDTGFDSTENSIKYVSQQLGSEQKTIARANIGAASSEEIAAVVNDSIGTIAYNAAAPTPGRSGKMTFLSGSATVKCAWITKDKNGNDVSETGGALVAQNDTVVIVHEAIGNTYQYQHVRNSEGYETINNQDIYNLSNKVPLTAGSYYTLATALAAIPAGIKKKGFILTFESSAYIWDTYQFYGSIDGWANTAYWTFLFRSGTNRIISVTNFDTIVEGGFYAGSGSSTGAPSSNYTWLVYFVGSTLSTTSGYQRAVAVGTTHIVVERTKVSGTWGPWKPTSSMFINVTNAIPLTAGQYYALTAAVTAVPTELRVLGLTITFATSATTWVEYQFVGASTSTWTTLTNWLNVRAVPFNSISHSHATFFKAINFFNKNTKTSGKYLIDAGAEATDASLSYSEKIFIQPFDAVYFSKSAGYYSGVIYNESDVAISIISGTYDQGMSFIAPLAASYVKANVLLYWADSFQVTINKPVPSEYHAFNKLYLTDDVILDITNNTNPLYGKTALFNGDSIMYGAGFAGGFAKLIADRNAMTNVNYAESGGSIAYVAADRYCISRHIATMQAAADYVILEGGVNDGALDVPVGAVSSGYEATLDDTTFCGAFENMLKQAIVRYPTAKIGYVFVHRMTVSQPIYNALMILMLNKWGIPYVDLFNTVAPLGYITALKIAYTANSDGWHPNELGYKKFYCDKIESWIRSL